MMKLPDITSIASRFGTIRVRNAANPFLWFGGAVWLPAWTLAVFGPNDELRVPLFLVGTLAFLYVAYSLNYLLRKHPDRLQSEDFQIRQQELQLETKSGFIKVTEGPSANTSDPFALPIQQGKIDYSADKIVAPRDETEGGVQ